MLSVERKPQAAKQTAQPARLTFGRQQLEEVTRFKIPWHHLPRQHLPGGGCSTNTGKGGVGTTAGAVYSAGYRGAQDAVVVVHHSGGLSAVLRRRGVGHAVGSQSGSRQGQQGSFSREAALSFLRHVPGVQQGNPSAVVVLAETSDRPQCESWLLRAARLSNQALAAREGNLLRQALAASAELAEATGDRQSTR